MKLKFKDVYILGTLALFGAFATIAMISGCGSHDGTDGAQINQVPPGGPFPPQPLPPQQGYLPPPPQNLQAPTGNYYCPVAQGTGQYPGYGYNGCNTQNQCPPGYIINQYSGQCTIGSTGGSYCQIPGYYWNGWSCVQNNFNLNCPPNSTFSYHYGGCVYSGGSYGNCAQPFQWQYIQGAQVCISLYTTGAPSSGYYYNGWGWYRNSGLITY